MRCIGSGYVLAGTSRTANGSYVNLGANTGPVKMVASHSMAQHACAVFESGKLKCWGAGGDGRLGLGDTVRECVSACLIGKRIKRKRTCRSVCVYVAYYGVLRTYQYRPK